MPNINRESSNRVPNIELTPNNTKLYSTGQNTNVNTSRVIQSQLGSKKGDQLPKIQIDAVDYLMYSEEQIKSNRDNSNKRIKK